MLYNGNDDLPAVRKLKLSDSFAEADTSGEFEWTATMYNLNHENNRELLIKCKSLSDYMTFVNAVKANKKLGLDKYTAVDKAVTDCIRNDILKNVLLKHRSEVVGMVLTEFNEEVYKKGIFEEGYSQGITQGITQGICEGQAELIDAIRRIKDGATEDDLLKAGFDPETVKKGREVFEQISG